MQMRAVLWDLDGTLIDSIALIVASFRHTYATHVGGDDSSIDWVAGIGRPLSDQLAEYARDAAELEAMIATYVEHNLTHHDRMAKPFEGAADTVRALHAEGIEQAIVTGKRRRGTTYGVRLLGVEDVLTTWVCADDVERGKPDPEGVLRALELLEVDASEAIFVGDSPHDMEAGRRAGVKTVAAAWGPFSIEQLEPHQPSLWLEDVRDALELATLGTSN